MAVSPTFFLHSQQRFLFFCTNCNEAVDDEVALSVASCSSLGSAWASAAQWLLLLEAEGGEDDVALNAVERGDATDAAAWRSDMVFFQQTEHMPPLPGAPKKPQPLRHNSALSRSCCMVGKVVEEK